MSGRDAPRIILFPPLLPVGTLIVSVLLQRLCPLGWARMVEPGLRLLVGAAVFAIGVALIISGNYELLSNDTAVRPCKPARLLVETGIYRWTRNPLYVGGSLIMLAAGMLFGLEWLPLPFLASLLLLHFGIVLPEERYLERKFGEDFRAYRARTPRYLGLRPRIER
jgi:protein-S-isoprenylcysteine O-methyltransferase Ste14